MSRAGRAWIGLSCAAVLGLACLFSSGSCTDASLYGKGMEDPSANRLGLTGRVCTDDPKQAGFPVRVLFLVDNAAGPLFASYDPEQLRLKAIREHLSMSTGNESFSFSVVGFAGRPRKLAPQEGWFTRNPGELENAVATLALPQGCVGPLCRDYAGGLDLAQAVIEGDMAELTAGERSRTQYAVVMMAAGPPSPLSCSYECCDPENQECESQCKASWACTRTLMREQVEKMRNFIEGKGVSSFSLHVMYLPAQDPEKPYDDEQVEMILEEMAFSGAGRYERFNSADGITLDHIGLRKMSSLFQAKMLLVSNMNVLPGKGDPVIDSDADGLGDDDEKSIGTDPFVKDTDGDGLGDYVEKLLSFDPATAMSEPPGSCREIQGPPYGDLDRDLLNDCEEALLGTNPSLPDTDGDGIPDWMEVLLGTDYLRADALDDADGDGSPNGDEVAEHTDPRSSDAASHLGNAYRYDVTDDGFVRTPTISAPKKVLGVEPLDAGRDTTAGLGILRYEVTAKGGRASWQDGTDLEPGPWVDLIDSGVYTLESSSAVAKDGPERWLSIRASADQLPPKAQTERLLIEMRERHCLSFVVRNVRLVETLGPEGPSGHNDVFIYFAESPSGRLTVPGLYRVAHIPVVYHPRTGREPSDLLVEIRDDEFTAIGL